MFARQFPHPVSPLVALIADLTVISILQKGVAAINRLHMKGINDPFWDATPPMSLHCSWTVTISYAL